MLVNRNTAIFLDRDGVINDETKQHYVKKIAEFHFLPGALLALELLTKTFNKIFIVTNQRVVGKQIISDAELNTIHNYMLARIKNAGGNITSIYYSTAINDDAPCRKPNIGMALQAQQQHKDIALNNSVMVGNKLSDMQFGTSAGMHTILVNSTLPPLTLPHPLVTYECNNLLQASHYLLSIMHY